MQLGDGISEALATVGITEERVERWLGRPCGCRQRREKLNALSAWARQAASGGLVKAKEHLEKIIS